MTTFEVQYSKLVVHVARCCRQINERAI